MAALRLHFKSIAALLLFSYVYCSGSDHQRLIFGVQGSPLTFLAIVRPSRCLAHRARGLDGDSAFRRLARRLCKMIHTAAIGLAYFKHATHPSA